MELPDNIYEAEEKFDGKQVYWKEYSSQRKKVVLKECEYCGEKAFKQLSNIKMGRGNYCGLSCSAKAQHSRNPQTGENNPNYLGKQDYVDEIKNEGECRICGESRDQALCFHHKNPENKIAAVSRMAKSSKYSLEDVKKELEKCELVCFNCHEIHYSSTKKLSNTPVAQSG